MIMGEASISPRYFHRDLSWLLFNRRVIQQAEDTDHPLLERLRFLAISANNADEFFMVRVPRVQSLVRLGNGLDPYTGAPQQEILKQLQERQNHNIALQADYYHQNMGELRKKGYLLKKYEELSLREHKQVSRYFQDTILPTLTPIGVDAYHAFPRFLEKALHFWVKLYDKERGETEAIIPIAIQLPRIYQLSARRFILLEEIIDQFLPQLFVGMEIKESFLFRITYDHDLTFQEESEEDLSEQMTDYLEERKKGLPSRIEVDLRDCVQHDTMEGLLQRLHLDQDDLYAYDIPLDLTFLFQLIDLVGAKNPKWLYPPLQARSDVRWSAKQILTTLDREDLLLQHPYEHFDAVINFLKAAVLDRRTVAIKMTLYRLAKRSRIIEQLKRAAGKGIQVTVLVEIKARFDEEHNLAWVQQLEEAGCFVSYGFPNKKTHSKAILVVQKDGDEIKRYAQIGTGNYNENNAKIYTDLSFFTSRDEYVEDLANFFNYVTGYRTRPNYQKIATSPLEIRQQVLRKIDGVIRDHQRNGGGMIFAKMNALTDIPLIDKLYEASAAGVKIQLQVRGACCLIPQQPGLSEEISVNSLVGRFLEHPRIYTFTTSKGTEWWISSADWMTRNMEKRVEIAAPLKGTDAAPRIQQIAAVYQKAAGKTFVLDAHEHYRRQPGRSAQDIFIQEAADHQTRYLKPATFLLDINERES